MFGDQNWEQLAMFVAKITKPSSDWQFTANSTTPCLGMAGTALESLRTLADETLINRLNLVELLATVLFLSVSKC